MSTQDDRSDQGGEPRTGKPQPDEETIEKAKEMAEVYRDDRPTAVMPGSGGTVSGTAVNDWLDDEGNPKGDDQPDDD
ncbi:MAG: hypothetical protein ACRDTN_06510 [Mycobacterium sp.]